MINSRDSASIVVLVVARGSRGLVAGATAEVVGTK